MSVLDRSELEASPLADLHAIADQLGLDGFRRLRKADLIDAILGEPAKDGDGSGAGRAPPTMPATLPTRPLGGGGRRRRFRARLRGGRSRGSGAATGARKRRTPRLRRGCRAGSEEGESRGRGLRARARVIGLRVLVFLRLDRLDPASRSRRRERARRGGGGRGAAQPNGRAGRSSKPDGERGRCRRWRPQRRGRGRAARQRLGLPARRSARALRRRRLHLRRAGPPLRARLRRPGDRAGAHAAPLGALPLAGTRSTRSTAPPPDAVSEGAHYEDLPVAYPSERLALNAGDPTLDAIEWLTPLGRGSRAVIVGPARAGKTETLKRLLGALSGERASGLGGDGGARGRAARGDRRVAGGCRCDGARRRAQLRRLGGRAGPGGRACDRGRQAHRRPRRETHWC